MSSILKALEKVEESHSTRRNGGVSGLIRGRERRPAWVVPAGVLGGAAVAALVTFAAMGGFSHPAAPVLQVKAVAKSAPVVVAPLYPVTEVPAAAQPDQTLRIEPAQAVVMPNPIALPAPSPALAAKPRHVPAVPVARPASAQPSLQPSSALGAPAKAAPVPVATPEVIPEKTRPEIRVTGIAWQKNGESSVAIVNGRSVQQGGMVDGLKVEEILPDSVRFSGGSGKLDVPLGGGE
jgi:general secretion pathway protein B